jgi:hypothetical protein
MGDILKYFPALLTNFSKGLNVVLLINNQAYLESLSVTKKVFNINYRSQCYKTFSIRNLQIIVISWSICTWKAFQCLQVRPKLTQVEHLKGDLL